MSAVIEDQTSDVTKADLAAEVVRRAQRITYRAKGSAWTNREVEELHYLLGQGRTYSFIANRLGRSRNAVAGRVHRMRGGQS